MKFHQYLIALIILSSCKREKVVTNTLFSEVSATKTNITFSNKITESVNFNFINYPYIYNGGGVAIIDFNNDGLEDIYFTSNQNSNKLYQNKGNFVFEDVTLAAGVEDKEGWTTGVSAVDINQDGWMDLYVCKSGALRNSEKRRNILYLNQKNGTFKNTAKEYGIDHQGFSTQAYFFDFDLDGDLDLYLVNHRPDFQNNSRIEKNNLKIIQMSDQLFEFDKGKFTNITRKSGIQNSAWGLSAAIGDFNNDTYPDIYVANDFLQPDYLYLNNKNGTFSETCQKYFKHISANSMGTDFADLNNDLLPDLLTLDMMAASHKRSKKNMATMSTQNFHQMVANNYHYQYMFNTLQLNRGNGAFSEIAQLAGVAKTDWSWAPLIADFNNDGYKDIFITNGIENDLSNQDFRHQMQENIKHKKKVSLEEAIAMMPSEKIANYLFINTDNLRFKNNSAKTGITKKVNSNGTAYADLDNDGDLDLIVNNQSETASIYQNNTQKNYLSVKLIGPQKNTNAIGSRVIAYTKNAQQLQLQTPHRGFQSSVTTKLHFGLDSIQTVDSLKVCWPNGVCNTWYNVDSNQMFTCKFDANKKTSLHKTIVKSTPKTKSDEFGINYKHYDSNFNDFKLQLLLPQKQSNQSAPIAVGDVNNDGLEDLYLGNGFGKPGKLYLQNKTGKFSLQRNNIFKIDAKYEDQKALFFDADGDSDLDLIVTSGGYELPHKSTLLQDRIYINDGRGNFSKGNLPKMLSNTKSICVGDYDSDGDTDIFIAGNVLPGKYPLGDQSFLLHNNKGRFEIKSIPINQKLGKINDVLFSDFDKDGDKDLVIAAEWMPVRVLENYNGNFAQANLIPISTEKGWFQSIFETDIDNNGYPDYIIGNLGENNKFNPSINKPLHIYADYLDNNNTFDVVLSKKSEGNLVPVRGKQCSTEQTPFLAKKIKTFSTFANATLEDIYGSEKLKNAYHLVTNDFSSCYLKNKGDKTFEKKNLPKTAQFAPIISMVNSFDTKNIVAVGNMYETEVETIRYDASYGTLLAADNQFKENKQALFLHSKNTKAIEKIKIGNKNYYIIFNNNDVLDFYPSN